MTPRSRVTIRDVAAHAGLSHQTVSRVINNNERVSPKTRERVEASIRELGYRPNAIARSMALGRTCMLACIAPNLTDYTFSSIIEGAETQAREHGYFLLAASAIDTAAFIDLIEQLVSSSRVAGIIVINPHIDERYSLIPEGTPQVYVGSHPKDEDISSVSLHDEIAAYDATRHLIQQGYQKLAMVSGPFNEQCAQDRCAGFERALKEAGLEFDESMVIEGDWSATSGRDALMRLAEIGQIPTAVFAQNDRMAIGIIQAARKMGIAVPKQLSVIGVDDMPLASYFDPPLTTMRQDIIQIGREAANLLIEKIEKPNAPKRNINIKASLIVRNSTHAFVS